MNYYNDDLNELLAFWKSSPAHRAALLASEVNVCGIGLAYGNGQGLPWRILGNVGLWRFDNGGPSESGAQSNSSSQHSQPVAEKKSEQVPEQKVEETKSAEPASEKSSKPKTQEVSDQSQEKKKEEVSRSPKVKGAIAKRYKKDGGEATYGSPVENELPAANGGYYQRFQKDNQTTLILWSSRTGAFAVNTSKILGQTWAAAGGELGYGFPTSNEYRFGIYTLQDFESGVLAHNSLTGEIEIR